MNIIVYDNTLHIQNIPVSDKSFFELVKNDFYPYVDTSIELCNDDTVFVECTVNKEKYQIYLYQILLRITENYNDTTIN